MVEVVFRSDGRYLRATHTDDPVLDLANVERGVYTVTGSTLALESYEFLGEPEAQRYQLALAGAEMVLTREEFGFTETYQFVAGSRSEVLIQEDVARDLVGSWSRRIPFAGTETYTFRPGGYYFVVSDPEDSQFPPEIVRGRYVFEGAHVTLRPYSGVEAVREADFFGSQLVLVRREEFSGGSQGYELVAGSPGEVRAKAATAEAEMSREGWLVGLWEIRGPFLTVDVVVRPDGHYAATNATEFLNGVVRGRHVLESKRIQFHPFEGQGLYARSNGEFGKVATVRELDYYDGELQFIDLGALSQTVHVARKRAGSEADVTEKVRQSLAVRGVPGWQVGHWEVQDPMGWMRFTLRPDGRYIVQSGAHGVPSQVERGQYVMATEKLSLLPYLGQGPARGFEIDYFEGDLFLAGDLMRLVVSRKLAGSEAEVIAKTTDPSSLKGELGGLVGRWTAPLPGQSSELVLRDDGEFRLNRCTTLGLARDYGLYSVDLAARTMTVDSRFAPVRILDLDFYGDTVTLHGAGWGSPSTYTVHLGQATAAIAASQAADAALEVIDAEWLARLPLAARRPGSEPTPTVGLPVDPQPGRVFENATVLANYQLYRRLIPGFVYFNVLGSIKSVAVVNTREWHFLPNGRVLVRFRNYFAGPVYPTTLEEVTDSWGAYQVGGKPVETDVLHRYADNGVFFSMDNGDEIEMTLEDGRRHLFLEKDYQILQEWASEQKPVPCALPDVSDPSLLNTGIALATTIPADEAPGSAPLRIRLAATAAGAWQVSGTNAVAGVLVLESAGSLVAPVTWQTVLTQQVAAGAFQWSVPRSDAPAVFFRVRRP